MTKAAAAAAVGKDVRGGGNHILYSVVVKKNSFWCGACQCWAKILKLLPLTA
jgi:hypothetical protein